jgi:DNA-binding SARP family transcriptional activator
VDDVRVRLLGGLVVEGYRANEVGSRKARTLVGVLAVSRRAAVSVDALAEVLWGDALPARPADQVGVLVSRLRGVLGADRFVRHDAGYAFEPDWVDLWEVEDGIAAAERAAGSGRALEARLAATLVLDLVRGPLLPEEDASWFDGRRAALDRSVAATRSLAAEAALAAGDPSGAIALAARSLDHDPYDEVALRAVMRGHVALGRPASALAAYAQARARLADDLGVSPTAATEDVHREVLRAEPSGPAPGVPERWDPLVQRARAELASIDFEAARRDAEEAVRRGAGASALEVAGWVAYYHRDSDAALRWAEAAVAAAGDEERRTSSLALAGRARHSRGDLHGAAADLERAVRSTVPGVRGTGEVWLGSLRVHQGRPAEALDLATRGAVDAAAMRHPFIIPHALVSVVYSLGIEGRVAEALNALEEGQTALDELGPAGTRFRPVFDNFWAWILGGIGRCEEAEARSRAALETAGRFSEPKHHALLDLAQAAIERDDPAGASAWLDQLEVPPDEEGAMAWHQRQRQRLLAGHVARLEGDGQQAAADAAWVRADALARGAPRAAVQAEVLGHLVHAAGAAVDPVALDDTLRGLDALVRLEGWRCTARLAAATRRADLWAAAEQRADRLVAACGVEARRTGEWIEAELVRLGRNGQV